jgi:hypothetical protein
MMNDGTPVMRRPRQAWPPAVRTTAAVIATAALALLAACSGSPSSSTGSGGSPNAAGSSSSPSAVAYSACMRSHAVPNFPDPASNGQVPKAAAQDLGVSSSQLQAAQTACQRLYPTNGGSLTASMMLCLQTGDCPQAMVAQVLTAERRFAQCMRSHGVPGWPDPTVEQGRPAFNLLHVHGFDPNSTEIRYTKTSECQRTIQGTLPGGVPEIRPGNPG